MPLRSLVRDIEEKLDMGFEIIKEEKEMKLKIKPRLVSKKPVTVRNSFLGSLNTNIPSSPDISSKGKTDFPSKFR
jgi:hypothetical protein